MRIEHRPATGIEDLRAAGDFLSQAWIRHAPDVPGTAGDLEWWFAQAWPDALGDHLELWSADGELVGWSWTDPAAEKEPGSVDWHVPVGLGLEDAILDWLDERGGFREATKWVTETDTNAKSLLESRGFGSTETVLSQYVQRLGTRSLPQPSLPQGYRLRSMRGEEDLERRVEVHRRAFEPSQMSIDKYRRLQSMPHYRLEHDLVVEGAGGEFAAFTMAWWDPVGRVGELEPVGTHPDHRRKGLGQAVNLAALNLFAELGADWALVFSGTANAASEALYRSVGFERSGLHRRYERRAARPGVE